MTIVHTSPPAELPVLPHVKAIPMLEMLKAQAEQRAVQLGNQITMEALIAAFNAGYAECESDSKGKAA